MIGNKKKENVGLPKEVLERLDAKASLDGKDIEEVESDFIEFLRVEYSIDDWREEADEYDLIDWAEMFVIATRLGISKGPETVTFVGHFTGLDGNIRDMRKTMRTRALKAYNHDADNALNNGLIGICSVGDNGCWNYVDKNGVCKTEETVVEGELPWFGFEHKSGKILCLLNNNEAARNYGKPMASEALARYGYFLGNSEAEFENKISSWRINLTGNQTTHDFLLGQPVKIQVRLPREGVDERFADVLDTNRDFATTLVYSDDFVSDELKKELRAERFWLSTQVHNEYVDLADLLEAYDDRKQEFAARDGGTGVAGPIVLTKGYVSRISNEAMESEYDYLGKTYRIGITNHNLQSKYGRDSYSSEITVWVSGLLGEFSHPFEFQNGDGEWAPYAERTPVLICGRIGVRPQDDGSKSPTIRALGVYVPPRTARPAATGGDTSLEQFGSDE